MVYFILAAFIVLLDQMSKYYLALRLAPGKTAALLPGILHMTYVKNTGAAFSFLSDMRWVLVAVSAAVIILIVIIMLRYGQKMSLVGRLGLAFVLGGAFSNLIDRVALGYVADFFEFEFVRFAIFNVADIFITVGGMVFCLYYIFGMPRSDLKKAQNGASASPSTCDAHEDDVEDGSGPDHS
ncbi:signal peptidase II [Oscillospiraceae bacterium CM]|nr:signal peptidase II [Oscillospiraceae bacterium CM]